MRFARYVYLIAGILGFTAVGLKYLGFLAGQDDSVTTNAPHFVHGFYLFALAWQVAFIVIGSDPIRYRPLMPVSWLEKIPFASMIFILYFQGSLPPDMLGAGIFDGTLGILFVAAYFATRK